MHQNKIPPGTLYLLILKALARSGELHGYEIADLDRACFRRRSSGRGSAYLSGAPAHARERLGHGEVGRDLGKSPRALLPPHAAWPKATRG